MDPEIPESDDPKPRPGEQTDRGKGRWGDAYRDHWQQEEASQRFESREKMLRFSPLEQGDFSGWKIIEDGDYSSETVHLTNAIAETTQGIGEIKPQLVHPNPSFFIIRCSCGRCWSLAIKTSCRSVLNPSVERIMDEFAKINRRVFRAFARLPVNFAICHDDIVLSTGPVCSPKWMRKYIFPHYEEFWDILRQSGKEVIFMVDGCVDAFVDNIMACGARGIISEPFTDYAAIAKRYPNPFIAGEGDSRVLDAQ